MTATIDPTSFADFHSAARAVLAFLHQRLGFGLWMVTRIEGDHWVALQTENHAYDQDALVMLRWTDTFCARMVLGEGPRVAPRISDVPAYAEAPVRSQIPIGAYIGVPLRQPDGRLFGTLCGLDPSPQPESIVDELGLVDMLAALLGTLLQFELEASTAQRRAEQARAEALTDTLTGLYNRRGWDTLVIGEEDRCRRYGHPACVVSLDLYEFERISAAQGHEVADTLLAHAGLVLRQNARAHDIVARVADDRFAILGVECERSAAESFVTRLRMAMERAAIPARIGLGIRDPAADLYRAWEVADQAMLRERER
jgi:diguanylate cyclase